MISTAAAQRDEAPDAIAASVNDLLGDDGWLEMIGPAVEIVRKSLAKAETLQDWRDALADVLVQLPKEQATEVIARASFAARTAGDGGQSLA